MLRREEVRSGVVEDNVRQAPDHRSCDRHMALSSMSQSPQPFQSLNITAKLLPPFTPK